MENMKQIYTGRGVRIKNAALGLLCSAAMVSGMCPAASAFADQVENGIGQTGNELTIQALDQNSDYSASLKTETTTIGQGKTFKVTIEASTKDATKSALSCMQIELKYDSTKATLGTDNIAMNSSLKNPSYSDNGAGKVIIAFYDNAETSLTVATLTFTASSTQTGDFTVSISNAIAGASKQVEDKGVNYSTESTTIAIRNTSSLAEAVAAAEQVERGVYTQASWDVFQDALAKAKEQLENPGTQDAIDAALAALTQAQNALERADKTLFPDVSDSKAWYYNSVYRSVDLGLFKGYSNGNFGPNDTLNRADAANILWRYLDPAEAAAYVKSEAKNTTGMADVADAAYYTGAANWAVAKGIINGKSDGKGGRIFDPAGTITAEQLCVILFNATGAAEPSGTSKIDALADGSFISSWAKAACEWALENGVLSGYNNADGTKSLRPQEGVSRARTATILVNAIDNKVLVAG